MLEHLRYHRVELIGFAICLTLVFVVAPLLPGAPEPEPCCQCVCAEEE